jgi:hypothetical protein
MICIEESEEVLASAIIIVLIKEYNLRGVLRLRKKGRIVLLKGRNEFRSVNN